jgi:AAA15 family ATPase/GTPase
MLIRLVVNNITSFGAEREFNMLPMPRLRTLKEHKYNIDNFDILKMASIYGANGSGKSNLVKSIYLLQQLVTEDQTSNRFAELEFKFKGNDLQIPQVLVVEFFQDNKAFIYGIEILNNIIITEELYLSGLDKGDSQLIFERKTDVNTKKTIITSPLLEKDKESQVLKSVIEKSLCKHNKTILKLLTTLENEHLDDVNIALDWFENTLEIVTPDAKPQALAHTIDTDANFKDYANDMMKSFHIGISDIVSDKKTIKEFFGEDDIDKLNKFIDKLDESPKKIISLMGNNGDEIIITKEEKEYYVKKLQIEHTGLNNKKAMFNLEEESDGTVRLLDLAPAFQDIVHKQKVYIIDEIERSIHPLLIKELIKKFSEDNKTNGQLIFTTHESNLLDQNIFRQDEIWFAEKDKNGSTDLYSLSDFKEHNTIDIRKGYLSGRYGSIPFLANLKDLNWHQYDIKK